MERRLVCRYIDEQRMDYIDEEGELRYDELDADTMLRDSVGDTHEEMPHGLTHEAMQAVDEFVYEMSNAPACAALYAAMQEAVGQQWVCRAQKYHKELRQALSAACRHEFLFDGRYQTGQYTYAIERLNQLYPLPFADRAPAKQLGSMALQRAMVPRSQHGYYDDVKLRAANDRTNWDEE